MCPVQIHQDTFVSVTLAIIGNVTYLGICILLYDTFRIQLGYIQDTMDLNPQMHDTQDTFTIHVGYMRAGATPCGRGRR